MKPLSANQAAKIAGKAKSTILDAIEKGDLSATKNNRGHWQIEPSELARVYDFKAPDQSRDQTEKPQPTTTPTDENRLIIERLQAELEAERRITANMEDTVADLRERLDKENADRRALTAMLTDQTQATGQGRDTRGLWARIRNK